MRIHEVSFYSKKYFENSPSSDMIMSTSTLGSYSYFSSGCKNAKWSWGQPLQYVDIFYNNIVKITTLSSKPKLIRHISYKDSNYSDSKLMLWMWLPWKFWEIFSNRTSWLTTLINFISISWRKWQDLTLITNI